ncbi:hypothetical protein [Fodinicola acaciae]|uniref:hypothetical protein n=1 Tax=Fodinicola acaciae TaxID=2681555 RepID=UPI0013D06232|nr:hypothetical protein [Fodinicola acaciae]
MTWPEIAEHWDRDPVVVPATPPLGPADVFAAIVRASAPFRAGTRFQALPDVRFRAGDGVIRAPGGLLPGDGDADLDGYLDRLDQACLLTVEQPLLLDFALWSAVRDRLAELWRLVGWPLLPVVPEFVIGHRIADQSDTATHAVLAWVLRGTVRADSGPVHEGELAYWPQAPRLTYDERCLVLRLRVPTDQRLAFLAVKDLLADAMQARRGSDAVPFGGDPAVQVGAVATELRECVRDPAIERMLRVQVAKRRSAGGLEPVPPPRAAVELTVRDRVRRTADVLRLPDGPGRWIWAVNGHGVPLAGSAAERVLAELPMHRDVLIGDLCQAVGAGDRSGSVTALLGMFYRLHAIQLVEKGT